MPRPTDPVKRVCYADDLAVWSSEVNIPDLEISLNNCLEEITAYLKDNSLLISDPMSSVTLLTPDTHQTKIQPSILIEDSHLPLVNYRRILGVYLDPSLSFNGHSQYVADRVSGRNNLLNALAQYCSYTFVCHSITTSATPERQMKETLYIRHRNAVEPMMVKNNRKATLQVLHTDAVDKAVNGHERNVVLDGRPPPISSSESDLTRKERSTLAQIRSGYCSLLGASKR